MKYMLLIHNRTTPTPQSPDDWARLSEDEQRAVFADYKAINETDGVTPGFQLEGPDAATTVRVEDGEAVTSDGPFGGSVDALSGYMVFEASDLDGALALAARVPAARMGGAVEVRPIVQR
jgi:hypothetical protein